MTADKREKELHMICLKFLEAFNKNDIDLVMSFFTEDAVYEEFHGKKTEGRKAIRQSFEKLFSGEFGKVFFDEDDTFISSSDNKVLSSWTLHLKIDNAKKTMRGLDLLHFDGNLIKFKGTYAKATAALYQDQ